MNYPESPLSYIEHYLSDAYERIVSETVQQIQKDFSMFGLSLPQIANTGDVYRLLSSMVAVEIDRVSVTNPAKLAALLYQIDVNEVLIIKEMQQRPELSRTEIITELIIYRELKKVVFRNYYKELKNKK